MLKTSRLDQKTIYFLAFLDTKESVQKILKIIITKPYTKQVSENALAILYWSTRIHAGMEKTIISMTELQNKMKNSIPSRIQMQGADLKGILPEGAVIDKADFTHAILEDTNMNNAVITDSHFTHTRCIDASFINTGFCACNFDNADFSGVNAGKAGFKQCSLDIHLIKDARFEMTLFHDTQKSSAVLKPFIGIVVKEKKLIPVSQWFYLSSIHSLITAMNGKLLIAGTGDGCIHLFETKTYKRIGVLTGHTGSVNCLVMDKTNRLFSGSDDKTIREWDTNTGKCVRILKGHESSVESLVISVDNKTLYSGSYDNTVIPWDIATGKRKATFVHMDGGMWLCCLPDGRFAGHPKAVRYLSYRDPETGKVYNAEDLADRFYRPKEVAEALK